MGFIDRQEAAAVERSRAHDAKAFALMASVAIEGRHRSARARPWEEVWCESCGRPTIAPSQGLCPSCHQRFRLGAAPPTAEAQCLACDTRDHRVLSSFSLGDEVVALCRNCQHILSSAVPWPATLEEAVEIVHAGAPVVRLDAAESRSGLDRRRETRPTSSLPSPTSSLP
jgi:hypothetical protein